MQVQLYDRRELGRSPPYTRDVRTVTATRYVAKLREGGSLPGLMEADDDGLYVVKFRGAGQGPKALAAEVIAGELARHLGLLVPEIVLVDVDPMLGRAEPDVEVHELLDRSPGLNVGLDFLPGALPFSPAAGPLPEPDLAAAVVWFDALVTNVDRTAKNTNLLVWHRRLWLIDHGASLYIQHTWRDAGHPRPRRLPHGFATTCCCPSPAPSRRPTSVWRPW